MVKKLMTMLGKRIVYQLLRMLLFEVSRFLIFKYLLHPRINHLSPSLSFPIFFNRSVRRTLQLRPENQAMHLVTLQKCKNPSKEHKEQNQRSNRKVFN